MQRRTVIFLLFTGAYFLSQFFRSANAVISADLASDLSMSASELGLMTSLFFAVFALAQIPAGIALDRWGPRWVTSSLMFIAVAGSLMFAVAQTFGMAAAARGLLGLGMASILMGGLKIFSQWYPPDRFATATGMLTSIGSLGALVAATPLAWMNVTFGWRSVFVAGAALIALSGASIAIWARNTPPGVSWSSQRQSQSQIGAITGNLNFWRVAMVMLTVGGVAGAYRTLWAGPYLFDLHAMDEISVGNLLLIMGIGTTVGFAVAGWLADRIGLRSTALGLGSLLILCLIALTLPLPSTLLGPVYLLFGFASGMPVALVSHARLLFPSNMTGQVLSLVNLAGFGGIFLLQWGTGLVISRFPADAAGRYPPQAYNVALLVSALFVAVALLWYLPSTRQLSSEPVNV